MEFQRLTKGNSHLLTDFVFDVVQPIPFFTSNSQAIAELEIQLQQKTDAILFCLFERKKRVGVLEVLCQADTMMVKSLLIKQKYYGKQRNTCYWLQHIEKLAKLCRVSTLTISCLPLNQQIKKVFHSLDYVLLEKENQWLFTKQLRYRTALVLGGGGARGAYQIGAWRALKELNISFDLICGTSVGALNGGLILQGDLTSAEKMWSEIDTGKILSFPQKDHHEEKYSLASMIEDIQSFTASAVASLGVSSEPLKNLIDELLDEKVMQASPLSFYVCTTQLPTMKEVVIDSHQAVAEELPAWLLASSSFFPAMQATKINDHYYADGGYRNNVPVDVALKNGATELIVIDVKGPGVTKPVSIPPQVATTTISSPWSLGTVLLFDGARSNWNGTLGYLETLKAFGKYHGYWYTLAECQQIVAKQKDYVAYLKTVYAPYLDSTQSSYLNKLLMALEKAYHHPVASQDFLQVVLELVAKLLEVSPTELYSSKDFIEAICLHMSQEWQAELVNESMLLSITEWVKIYVDKLTLPTEKQQVAYLYQRLKQGVTLQEVRLKPVIQQAPIVVLLAVTLVWLDQEVNPEPEEGVN